MYKKRRCTIPSCSYYGSCDKHHIIPQSEGGANAKHNLVDLCPNCHRQVSTGELVIYRWAIGSNGRELLFEKVERLTN